MASVIDTAIAEPVSRLAYRLGRSLARWRQSGGGRWPISPLTRRILAVNVLALALLAGGFLYLGKYQASLVSQQIEALKMQGEVFAAALGEGAVLDSVDEGEILLPDLARQMMRRLVEPTRTRARLFDATGNLVADSRVLRGPGGIVQIRELPPPESRCPTTWPPCSTSGPRAGRPGCGSRCCPWPGIPIPSVSWPSSPAATGPSPST